jgi:alpha-N-arabinofuranosidase
MRLSFILILFPLILGAQEPFFTNPIYPGGYPDPSICRVGSDYYIVNSTFEYFPGLPIHHSRDLVNWELVGYGLHRKDQCTGEMNLVDVQSRGGIHAPTIRHHNGTFYIITTNVYAPEDRSQPAKMINFIITAERAEGPWSDPHIIEGAPGIDPDLFFDDDGKAYYVGTHAPGNPNQNGIGEIWVQELDLENWKLVGERASVWQGACGGCCVEGPHMYKVDGTYYLLIAEGGTGHNHAVMIAASDYLTGPFESNPRNPILTSRHLSLDHWVNSTGHADLVELPDGRWYMVALGIRGEVERRSNMGRETHLIPVIWEPITVRWEQVSENRWEPVKYMYPVCAPQTGRVERYNPLPFEDAPQYRNDAFMDHFDSKVLSLPWNFRRVPMDNTYSLSDREGYLRLFLKPEVISERGRCSLMGVRQGESDFEYAASMQFNPEKEEAEAGISLFQQDNNYLNFTVIRRGGKPVLQLVLAEAEKSPAVLKEEVLDTYTGEIFFRVESRNNKYRFEYSLDGGEHYTAFKETGADHILSMGYTGAYLGVYATSHGNRTREYADFDWIHYQGHQRQIKE